MGFQDYRRVKTLQEEKQDADEATPEDDEGDSAISGRPPSVMDGEEEGEEEVDLDTSMEDLDMADVWLDAVSNKACSFLPCSHPSTLHIQVMLNCSVSHAWSDVGFI